jgi:hypothetical protein
MPCQRLAGKAILPAFQAGGFTIFNIYPVESRFAGLSLTAFNRVKHHPSLVILFHSLSSSLTNTFLIFRFFKNWLITRQNLTARNIFQSVLKSLKNIDIVKKNKVKIENFLKKEFDGFLEYIDVNNFENLVKDNDEIDILFETYKKTYVPKSRKIYLSMPYHIHEDLIYFVVKDVVNNVSEKIGETIELIRTDKRPLGVHRAIESRIYDEIQESDLMIADITNNNPNVSAEVGYKLAIDKLKGLKQPQLIFIKNTRGYYERTYYKEKLGKVVDGILIKEHIRRNKLTETAFNFAHIEQIEFDDVEFLQAELEKILLNYYSYYQIIKG